MTRKKEQNLTAESSAKNLLSRACKQPDKSLMLFISKVREVKAIRKEIKPWEFCSVILMGENFLIKYLFMSRLSCASRQSLLL
ncbi:hypothetical protein IHO40_01150 [Wolbachia endosymbiont of Mansonella ozzardi]|uniref:hypothetical protein n=1 Tax=Wolbachia endosymbiont of Mansonella ozzardi TaxID=137464 RepID=UPI001CE09DB5|nr:hypothetical protein [Wolbachia endosymbiont of Mansonella ozzardi]MCA4774779.1 hypothetical protein [Wolbachia endosymbiont of Mansonella ozzardi]